jgi:hypothetical protein
VDPVEVLEVESISVPVWTDRVDPVVKERTLLKAVVLSLLTKFEVEYWLVVSNCVAKVST